MKTTFTFLFMPLAAIMIFVLQNLTAQNTFPASGPVGIGTALPNPSSLLEIKSTGKGILIPRMTTAQRTSIVSPASGLLVYQINSPGGFYYYNAGWTSLANSTLSNLTGSAIAVNLVPGTDNSRNLGSPDRQWKNLYLSGYIYLDAARFISNPGTNNTFVGAAAGNSAATGNNNSGLGFNALKSITSGYQNVAVGSLSLFSNNTGFLNTATGHSALHSNTSGSTNNAYGFQALYSNTTGTGNSAIGVYTLLNNTTGINNTGIGNGALYSNTTGAANTASGAIALYSNTTGYQNAAMGYQSLYANIDGYQNTASGYQSLSANTTGYQNTAAGALHFIQILQVHTILPMVLKLYE